MAVYGPPLASERLTVKFHVFVVKLQLSCTLLPAGVAASAGAGGAEEVGNRPYTTTLLENVARYTLPSAMVGGQFFAKRPELSRAMFCSLLHSCLLTSAASNARKMPATTALLALLV